MGVEPCRRAERVVVGEGRPEEEDEEGGGGGEQPETEERSPAATPVERHLAVVISSAVFTVGKDNTECGGWTGKGTKASQRSPSYKQARCLLVVSESRHSGQRTVRKGVRCKTDDQDVGQDKTGCVRANKHQQEIKHLI